MPLPDRLPSLAAVAGPKGAGKITACATGPACRATCTGPARPSAACPVLARVLDRSLRAASAEHHSPFASSVAAERNPPVVGARRRVDPCSWNSPFRKNSNLGFTIWWFKDSGQLNIASNARSPAADPRRSPTSSGRRPETRVPGTSGSGGGAVSDNGVGDLVVEVAYTLPRHLQRAGRELGSRRDLVSRPSRRHGRRFTGQPHNPDVFEVHVFRSRFGGEWRRVRRQHSPTILRSFDGRCVVGSPVYLRPFLLPPIGISRYVFKTANGHEPIARRFTPKSIAFITDIGSVTPPARRKVDLDPIGVFDPLLPRPRHPHPTSRSSQDMVW